MGNPRIEVEIGAVIDGLKKGFGESVKIIDKLEEQARGLELALREATDLQTIGRLNQDLARTRTALSQLRTTGLDPLTKATSNYNSVGIEFSRIIQDAPFGIIGVGNNITQLASSFQTLRASSTSTGAALKTALSSIIAPTNLLVLGISAVTTAFTLYSQSARSTKGPIDDLKEAQDAFNDSLKETDRLLGREVLSGFLKEVGLIEQQNIGGRLIDVPTFTSAGQVVDALSEKIQNLRKGELDLLAKFLKTQIAESLRTATNNAGTFAEELARQDVGLYEGLLQKINTQLSFYKDNTEKSTKANKDFFESFNDNEDAILRNINALRKLQEQSPEAVFARATGRLTGQEGAIVDPLQEIQNKIAGQVNTLGVPVKEFADEFQGVSDRIRLNIEDLSSAFSGLGSLLGQVFGNNPALGQFVAQFAGFATKLIATNFKIATANAVTGATNASLATGPAAPFTLPAFIAASVGLVASAFAAFGGGRGSSASIGTSGVGGGVGSTFTGGATGGLFDQNREIRGELVARGTDLVYVFNQASDRINKG